MRCLNIRSTVLVTAYGATRYWGTVGARAPAVKGTYARTNSRFRVSHVASSLHIGRGIWTAGVAAKRVSRVAADGAGVRVYTLVSALPARGGSESRSCSFEVITARASTGNETLPGYGGVGRRVHGGPV
jgi:hypothetical protein